MESSDTESTSDTETDWESESSSDTETETHSTSIQKLIKNHRYLITIDETNQRYYGTCQCPDSYLFSDVIHFNLNKYIELKSFSEKDHFVDTHEKMY